LDRQEVFNGVKKCLVAALDIEPEVVTEEARIIADLGADSLDLLDLVFQLEQEFGIKISPREIERRTREKLGNVEIEHDGVYTGEMVAELRLAMPEVPDEELPDGLRAAELPRRFRVATMINLVSGLLAEQNQQEGVERWQPSSHAES
jgi:acyl carrier protein